MTTSGPDSPPPPPPPPPPLPPKRVLDLSLFRLPTALDPGNAEVGVGRRNDRGQAVKRRFWGTLAKRIDLTGRGSLVASSPYGTRHDRVLAGFEARVEHLFEIVGRHENAKLLVAAQTTKPSQLPRNVTSLLEEVTPQFSLRNIPRVERSNATPRWLDYRYAVWREDDAELLELARHPKLERIEFLSELSSAVMKELKGEAWGRVYGLSWENDLAEIKPAVFRPPSFAIEGKKRIPIAELRDEPAPPNRETSSQRHTRTFKELGKRFDATKP
jgi:hypothetical protein